MYVAMTTFAPTEMPEEQIEEHVDDGRRAAHGGLVLAGGELAEDGDVDSVEQLPQDAAERQRQREQDQFPGEAARSMST